MGDDWFGHRDPFTGEPRGDKDEYTIWDYALQNAFQAIEDYTDEKSGLLAWELDDDQSYVEAVKRYNKFQAAIDSKTRTKRGKAYEPEPGEYFIPRIKSHRVDENGAPVYQTMREWMQKQIDEGN